MLDHWLLTHPGLYYESVPRVAHKLVEMLLVLPSSTTTSVDPVHVLRAPSLFVLSVVLISLLYRTLAEAGAARTELGIIIILHRQVWLPPYTVLAIPCSS